MDKLRLGERLVKETIITETQLAEALVEQSRLRNAGEADRNTLIGVILINKGYVTQDLVYKFLIDGKVVHDLPETEMQQSLA